VAETVNERSLYDPILAIARTEGLDGLVETSHGGGPSDVLLYVGRDTAAPRVVLEAKIGGPESLGKAVAQASRYARDRGLTDSIVVSFPEEIRAPVESPNELRLKLEEVTGQCIILTGPWTDCLRIPIPNLLRGLKERFAVEREAAPSLSFVIDSVRATVVDLATHLRSRARVAGPLIDEIVGRFDLFVGLSGSEDRDKLRASAFDLASYLLANQILFYHLYERATKRVEALPRELSSFAPLRKCLRRIRGIDFEPIYATDVLDLIAEDKETVSSIEDLVLQSIALRPEHLKQDLLGRLFHELLPPNTRKVLAAFYTKPIAAQLLSSLAVTPQTSTVIDPACGSGTLLVASYHELRENSAENDRLDALHRDLVERRISGIDLMPFAAHLTALNLSSQRLTANSDNLRVATADSLSLYDPVRTDGRFRVAALRRSLQRTLQLGAKHVRGPQRGAIAPSGKGKGFEISPVDLVIMNPPFTDRQKLDLYASEAAERRLAQIERVSGSASNLWTYFLALADVLCKPGGTIAAVVPINLMRGKTTEPIRRFLLSNYTWKYVVKTTNEVGFSEGASFRDILLVAAKASPTPNHQVRIALLTQRLGKIEDGRGDGIADVAQAIKSGRANEAVETRDFSQAEMMDVAQDLMGFVGASSVKNLEVFRKTLSVLRGQPHLRPFPRRYLAEGFGARPQGLAGLIYVMRDRDTPSRFTRSLLKLEAVHRDTIDVGPLSGDVPIQAFTFPRDKTLPAVRNLVGQGTMDISGRTDFILCDSYPGLKLLAGTSAWSGGQRGRGRLTEVRGAPEPTRLGSRTLDAHRSLTSLALLHRFDPTTPNSKVVAIWSRERFVPNNNLFVVDVTGGLAKALALYLNSSFSIAQLLLHKQETTRTLIDVKIADLEGFVAPNPDNYEPRVVQSLERAFDKFADKELGSLTDDYSRGNSRRMEIDEAVGEALDLVRPLKQAGVSIRELHSSIADELRIMKEMLEADDESGD
jgi:hypothetical protein